MAEDKNRDQEKDQERRGRSAATGWIVACLLLTYLLILRSCFYCPYLGERSYPPPSVTPRKVQAPVVPVAKKEIKKQPVQQPAVVVPVRKPVAKTFSKKQKGIAFVTWNKDYYSTATSDEALKKITTIGAQWVGLHTTWYQDNVDSLDMHPTNKTPSDESLVHAIRTIHSLGLKVLLKPQLDLIDTTGGVWRGDIEFTKENDWQTWFDNYTKFMVHYAQIAQEEKVEMFCVGTELSAVATLRPDLWKQTVIKSVRQVYEGPLTYAANWYEEYKAVKFWDALDYAGLDPYFPLSDKDKPTYEEVKKGWESHISDIETWQADINKQVIFTEIGYKSSTGAARSPFDHRPGAEVDLQQQADCYTALLETCWDKPWFSGVYWWEWGSSVHTGGPTNRGFTPQNKPAEQILSDWYKNR
jgi:hypothetical protein